MSLAAGGLMKLVPSWGCAVVPDKTNSAASARMGWLNNGESKLGGVGQRCFGRRWMN